MVNLFFINLVCLFTKNINKFPTTLTKNIKRTNQYSFILIFREDNGVNLTCRVLFETVIKMIKILFGIQVLVHA